MTKEQLDERVKTLTDERLKAVALVAMYDGAMQDCQYWLEQLTKENTDVPDSNTG